MVFKADFLVDLESNCSPLKNLVNRLVGWHVVAFVCHLRVDLFVPLQ
jgi:hypothetical protein